MAGSSDRAVATFASHFNGIWRAQTTKSRFPGSLTDWSEAVRGAQAVVHLAARVHHPNEEGAVDLYRTVNTEGTLQLARAAAAAGVKRFIFVSTALVNGSCTDGRAPFREDDDFHPRGIYGLSKAEAELGLAQMSANMPMTVTVLRPPMVYGPGAAGNFKLLVRAIQLGIPLPFASFRNRRAFVSVQNLASFIANRLTSSGQLSTCFWWLTQNRFRRPSSSVGWRAP